MTGTGSTAPAAGAIAAFFDFDGTVIDGFSATAFLADRVARDDLPLAEAVVLARSMSAARRGGISFETFMRRACHSFRGYDAPALAALGDRLHAERLAAAHFPEALARVRDHQQRGHTVVFATSALPFQVEPAARRLGIADVLCTQLELRDGVCTGRIAGPIVWGEGKAAAVRRFAGERGIDLAASYAYGNGDEDIPYLRTVGRPHAVNPAPELERVAAEEGWPVLRFAPHDRPSQLARAAGTARWVARTTARTFGLGRR